MLSSKVKNYAIQQGWWDDSSPAAYEKALLDLGVDIHSDFAEFFLHAEDGPTFLGRNQEIYQVCCFFLNSNYSSDVIFAHNVLKITDEYLPLDSFEGEGGFFYNKATGKVVYFSLKNEVKEKNNDGFSLQWDSFSEFLEWFFDI